MELNGGWVGTDLGDFRPCEGTYQLYSYAELPPLDETLFTGSYDWLGRKPAGNPVRIGTGVRLAPVEVHIDLGDNPAPDGLMDEWDRRYQQEQDALAAAPAGHAEILQQLQENLRKDGLTLPPAFVTLMSDPELLAAVPTCTDCLWDIPAEPVVSPLDGEARLIRFLRDSQDCLIWYLYLNPDGSSFVVVSPIDFDDADELTKDEVVQQFWGCATEFEQFVYRFWIENSIWYALSDENPLTPAESAYAEYYRR